MLTKVLSLKRLASFSIIEIFRRARTRPDTKILRVGWKSFQGLPLFASSVKKKEVLKH
jgi:hypothetical protein